MKWINTLKREYPPLILSLFFKGYNDKNLWKKYIKKEYMLKDLRIVASIWFYTDEHMEKFAKKLMDGLFTDRHFFIHLCKASRKYEKNLLRSAKISFKEFSNAFIEFAPTLALYFMCDGIIEQKVSNAIVAQLGKEKGMKLVESLKVPVNDNIFVKERADLFKCRNLDQHIMKYSWIHSRYGRRIHYTKEAAKKSMQGLKEYLETRQIQTKEAKKAVALAKNVLPLNEKPWIDIMQFFIFYRTHRTDMINKALYEAYKIIMHEAEKKGMTYDEFMYSTYDEINSDKIPSSEILAQRKKGFSFIGKDSKYKIYIGKRHDGLVKKYLSVDQSTTEVKGIAVFNGYAKGTAKLVYSPHDILKVCEGDILIASMTTPNMVPAMEKAAAFVTNEGGITCHASIVAREMKKPCVTATKIATRVFKDGDIVEVDANKGIVRKVS